MRTLTFKPYLAILLTLAWSIATVQAQFTFSHVGSGATGSITANAQPGSFTFVGGGNDIWDNGDDFDFAHNTVSGDFDIRVRVEALEPVARWTKAGLMARESLARESRMAFNRVTPLPVATGSGGNGADDTRFAYRTGNVEVDADTSVHNGGRHEDGSGAPQYPNGWLRLTRVGNTFNAYRSTDGFNWALQGSQDTATWGAPTPAPVAADLLVGLAVSRHSGGDPLATCEFRDYGTPNSIAAITRSPASQTILENHSASFDFRAVGGQDIYDIQWRRNGTDIPGATGPTYTTPPMTMSESGTAFSVSIRNKLNGSTAVSSDAIVTVIVDDVAPTIVSASTPFDNGSVFNLVFSEAVNEADAENLAGYSITGSAPLTGAELQADGKTVRFTTSSSFYTAGCLVLTVPSVRDRAIPPNVFPGGSIAVITAKGGIRSEIYSGIGGVTTYELTRDPKYVNKTPDITGVAPALELDPAGDQNDYGAQLIGYLHPQVSGAYRFFVAADDHAQLWLSTDEEPANKVLIAREPNWGAFREYTGMAFEQGGRPCCSAAGTIDTTCLNQSELINLEAGCKYFIQFIYKEGSGGDYGSVAWQLPGGAVPANGSLPIQGAYLSPYEPVAPTPVEDTTPPSIALVAGSTTLDRISVTFSEPVEEASAEEVFNYPNITDGMNAVSVLAAELLSDGKTVLLTLTAGETLQLDTTYTVTANAINDRASPQPNTSGTLTGSFHSVVEGCGGLTYEAFLGPGGYRGRAICGMLEHPSYPSNPFMRRTIDVFDTGVALGTTDLRNDFGGRIRGVFVPPYTGDWIFYMRSDDSAQLLINPNGIDPAGAIGVAWEYECCQALDNLSRSSADFPAFLIGGRPYYIEGRYKEAGGGDYLVVGARIRGSADPVTPITSRDLGQYAEPGFSGGFEIVQQPADQSVTENREVTFTVQAASELGFPICYQWNRNGEPIPGATGSSYTFRATLADDGAVYSARASIIGAVRQSAGATLNVDTDSDPPRVVSVKGADTMRNVYITFDELVDPASAGEEFNYDFTGSGLTLVAADALADGRTVRLTTSPQTEGQVYTFKISGINDVAASANGMPDTTVNFTAFVFSPGFLKLEYYGGIGGGALGDLTGNAKFPDSPDQVLYMPAFDTRTVFPDNSHDNYGARITGLYIPPTSGNWLFYLATDDASRLSLDPTGTDPGAKVTINEEAGCCGAWVKAGVSPSAPQTLAGGSRYYVEGLYKEGGGGDYMKVAARLEGQPAPSDNPNQQMPVSANAISSADIGVFADPTTGASGTITQQPTDQTACIDPLSPSQAPAVFTIGVESAPAGVPTAIRWQRWDGSQYVDITATTSTGANGLGPSYSFLPTLADHGSKFRALLYVLGLSAPIVSDEVTLSVYQANTPPAFNVASGHTSLEDGGPQIVPGFASGITPHTIPRTPVTFASDFTTRPAGMTLYGIAAVRNGRLELTTPVNSANGAAALDAPIQSYESVDVSWKSYIGDGAGGGADGYSFNIGDSIAGDPAGTGVAAEEGHPSANLNIAVDTFNNADLRNPDEGISIEWRGTEVAYQNIPKNDTGDGNYLRKSRFVDARLTVSASGVATLTYDGNTISGQIPDYTGVRANRAVFWARTGNANDNQWIDDLDLKAFPFDRSSAEAGQTVTFELSNNNPAAFSQQPAISSDGTLTYTAAPNACTPSDPVTVTVVARDDGGTLCNGDDTSDPKTFTITIQCVNDPPRATPQVVVTHEGVAVTITLTGEDPDGDQLTASVVTQPQHGTLTVEAGVLTYNPHVGFSGTDEFTFTVSDGSETSPPATVTITVIPNTKPTCVASITPGECGVTFPHNGQLHTIAVKKDYACLSLDASASTDPDGDPITVTWTIDGTNTVSGTVVTNCLDVGSHTIVVTVTDDKGGKCEQIIQVTVITPSEAVEECIDLVESTPLERKNKRPLLVSLKAAKAKFDREGWKSGASMLRVFQFKVQAQIARRNPAEAAAFIECAENIINAIKCVIKLPRKGDDDGDDDDDRNRDDDDGPNNGAGDDDDGGGSTGDSDDD